MKIALSHSNATWKASVLLAFFVLLPTVASAQQKPKSVDPKRLAVDVVSVHQVGRICGIIVDRNEQSVSMVVRREWLKQTYPEFFASHLAAESQQIEAGRDQIKKRIADWRSDYEGDDAVAIGDFLDENLRFLELDKPVDVSGMAFTIVELDRKQTGRIYAQTEDKHRIAGIAWSEKVANVESTSLRVLERNLKKNKVDIAGYQLKLGNELPAVFESDEKWEARKALIEFGILERVEFQGSGTAFFQRGKKPTAAQAMQGLVNGGGGFSQIDRLGKELGLPEFKDRGNERGRDINLAPMIKAAEEANRRAFSVSILTQGPTVNVKMQLYFKALDNHWYPLAEYSNSERLSDQNSDEIDQVKQDPQVSKMLETLNQVGGGVDRSILDKALRSGVATKKALEKSMDELDKFVDQYAQEIDNPPVKTLK